MITELILYAFILILGLILGSYLNSWVWRVYRGKWQWGARSMCVHCGRQLLWSENIPLISFIILRGKCKSCKAKIPVDYFLVEFFTAILLAAVTAINLNRGANEWQLWRDLFFTALLIVVFVYDLKYYIILTGVVYGGALVAFLVNYFSLHLTLYSLLLGALIGSGFFWLQYVLSRGRWIGGGDVRLGVMMGTLLGWPNILVALFISYVLGSIVAIPLLVMKKKGMKSEIPFGTFLSVGTFIAMLWGNQVISWYWNLIKW